MATPERLVKLELKAERETILAYAKLTNDFNPIHIDPEFAATTPMNGVIAHGTMSLNLLWGSLALTFGPSAIQGAQLDVRFSRPVRLGDKVETGGQPGEDAGRFEVWVRNQNGEDVIHGVLTLANGGSK